MSSSPNWPPSWKNTQRCRDWCVGIITQEDKTAEEKAKEGGRGCGGAEKRREGGATRTAKEEKDKEHKEDREEGRG